MCVSKLLSLCQRTQLKAFNGWPCLSLLLISIIMAFQVLIFIFVLLLCFATANPRGLELVLPQCFEDKEVISFKSYFGGIEGSGEYIWYRTLRKLKGLELSDVSAASEDVITVGNSV